MSVRVDRSKIRVTIVLVTHQRVSLLKRAIFSVIAQDFHSWECLVVSDFAGEFDEISATVASFKDSRIRFLEGRGKGANASRNLGMEAARGDIIAFLDDDDYWLPEKLSRHVELHLNADFVYSNCITECHSRHGTFQYVFSKNIGFLNRTEAVEKLRSMLWCPKTSSCVTLSRRVVQKQRWDEGLESFQDWDMWYRLLLKENVRIAYVDEPVCVFYQHLGDRVSKNVKKRISGAQMIAEKHSLPCFSEKYLAELAFRLECHELREVKVNLSVMQTLNRFSELAMVMNKKHLSSYLTLLKSLCMPSPHSRYFAYFHSKYRVLK